jgi:thioredoxin-related protein
MVRKSLLLLFVISLLSGTLLLIYFLYEKISRNYLVQQNLEVLANFPLFDLDSTRFYLKPDRKTMLIYFDSECNYCEEEINDLSINIDSFKDLDIVLMSSELIRAIKLYQEKNRELQLANIRFVKINTEEAYDTFGSLAVPQIFIYRADGALIKKFKGETTIDAILQYI